MSSAWKLRVRAVSGQQSAFSGQQPFCCRKALFGAAAFIMLLVTAGCDPQSLSAGFGGSRGRAPSQVPELPTTLQMGAGQPLIPPTQQADPAQNDVNNRIQNFVARFPEDDNDRQARQAAVAANGTPAVAPTPNPTTAAPGAQATAAQPANGIASPSAATGTGPRPQPAVSAAPDLNATASATPVAANRPVVQAMQPVQALPPEPAPAAAAASGGSAIEASPLPQPLKLPVPERGAKLPRIEIVDIRPAAGPIGPPVPEAASSANQPVQPVAAQRGQDLVSVIGELETAVKAHPEHLDDQFKLRLLYLATGQEEKAADPISGADPVQTGLLNALFRAVAAGKNALRKPSERGTPALTAVDELRRLIAQQSPVIIPKVALVTRVNSFGDYDAVNPPRFPAGAGVHVFLYAEVANFRSEPTGDGRLRTVLNEKVEIFDATGKIIWQQTAAGIEDRVLSPRRDFFVPLEIQLPAETPAGEYVLKVTIEDVLGATTDQQRMTFTIGG
jgi:hypothetical protein